MRCPAPPPYGRCGRWTCARNPMAGPSQNPDGEASPPRVAVALRYETRRDAAPRVLATGRGSIAETILRRAEAAGVAIRRDASLTEALAPLALGETIPPELYRAVAEVLAYVYGLDAGSLDAGP